MHRLDEHYLELCGALPLLSCRLRLVGQKSGLAEHLDLMSRVGLSQLGPAAQASADVATLMGDEDQLGFLQRVHADSLTSPPSRK
jgi:hypothetical protein